MKFDVTDSGSTAVRERTGAKSKSGKSDSEKKEMQQKMEAAGTPGPAHKALEALVGDWKAEMKCWMDPEHPAQVSQGTAKATWTLKGRFLEEKFEGEMMGKAFTGLTLMGYDNTKQTFNSIWISDMQTSMFTSEGKGDSHNKVITLKGETTCAATGRTDIPMKTVLRLVSHDKHVLEMFDGRTGEDVKVMEIEYTRK